MEKHAVTDGDCVLSIANRYGFLWESVWNHPANAALKALRQDPNVLLPGDEVALPEKGTREEVRGTDARHRFVVRANPAKVKIRILLDDEPLKNAPYALHLPDGDVRTGQLDFEGFLTEDIPAAAAGGELVVGRPTDQMRWSLQFGGLDPITTPSGVDQRLVQLGFDAQTDARERIKAFQRNHRIDDTGEADAKTRSILEQQYGE